MLLVLKVPTIYLGRQICEQLQFSVISALTQVCLWSCGSTRPARYAFYVQRVLSRASYPVNSEIEWWR